MTSVGAILLQLIEPGIIGNFTLRTYTRTKRTVNDGSHRVDVDHVAEITPKPVQGAVQFVDPYVRARRTRIDCPINRFSDTRPKVHVAEYALVTQPLVDLLLYFYVVIRAC